MNEESDSAHAPRPFINMYFRCCNAYARVYLNREETAFAGHCPKCALPIRIPVGPGGSGARFWTAG